MLEKIIDATGKSAVVAIPVSEAAARAGFFIDPYMFQLAGAVAAVALIIDKIIRLTWDAIDRRKSKE